MPNAAIHALGGYTSSDLTGAFLFGGVAMLAFILALTMLCWLLDPYR